ncbi:MAG: hypothetical protein JNL41_21800 [Phenylobacterium sp.]|uniref:hypothetical protein n=1 Tax=Phenylobacterium sp. TaxID=1871053 RepID=UPI001A4DE203|nr:hypothetical protein [Phenylobacterium sp.]MBL8556921.1 hypothetical protein [Phenylobacterium sp.]
MIAAVLAAALAALPDGLVQDGEAAAYESMILRTARAADASFSGAPPCEAAGIEHLWRQPVKIADRPDFLAVRERVKLTGCGRSSVQNLNVGRTGGSPPWRMTFGLPGESFADMPLQQSTLPAAMAQAAVDLPAGCQERRMADVYVAARPGHVDAPPPGGATPRSAAGRIALELPADVEAQRDRLDLARAWVEVWPITLCGQDRTTAVVFMPIKDQKASAYLFLPVWRQIQAHGAGARPAPAPPE